MTVDALVVENLWVEYTDAAKSYRVTAVSDVSLTLGKGETLGVVGESGCGKSSLALGIIQLPPPKSGRVLVDGIDLTGLRGRALRRARGHIQMIFQDPVASLNPRRTVGEIVGAPAAIWRGLRGNALDLVVDEALSAVGLDPASTRRRYPGQFSGGQCQRISIARALTVEPKVLVCDEVVSSLDVSIQAQILNVLQDLHRERGLSMLFISHDLAVVKHVSDRILVMYLGRVSELGPTRDVYERPAHPYTRALLASVPVPDPTRRPARLVLRGDIPSPANPPSGCRFRTRCPRAEEICAEHEPALQQIDDGRWVSCHFPFDA